jgi:glycerophosphoryl diester phosphodiesterase
LKLRDETRYLRVGHRGAAALAPENTLRALAAALDHNLDLIEFDVLELAGELVLAHSDLEVPSDRATLDEALDFLAANAPGTLGIDLDLKSVGCEDAIVAAIARHGLLERTLVCSVFATSLRAVRRVEPRLATGLSYPWDRHNLSERRLARPAVRAGIAGLRRVLPARIGPLLRRAEADAAMLSHLVLSAATVRRCHALGKAVFAWTVDDPELLEAMLATGVDGVISNDPRIFSNDLNRTGV